MKKLSSIFIVVLFLSLFLVGGAFADQVQFQNVGPGGSIYVEYDNGFFSYKGTVNAGIYNLLVNGVATDSFCIDLQDHAITTPQTYGVVALENAADPTFGPMGTKAAHDVSVLWAMGYAAARTDAAAALSLQVAIWEVAGEQGGTYDLSTGKFQATNIGAQALLNDIKNFTGTPANLVGLTNTQYQDYVKQVPEPTFLLLLGLGLVGLTGLRRKFQK